MKKITLILGLLILSSCGHEVVTDIEDNYFIVGAIKRIKDDRIKYIDYDYNKYSGDPFSSYAVIITDKDLGYKIGDTIRINHKTINNEHNIYNETQGRNSTTETKD